MNNLHNYSLSIRWTGNKGSGTSSYRAYDRSHSISIADKAEIRGSSDPAFLGDRTRHNPEELFVASLSSCHMLWYLHLCSEAGVVITGYVDNATGIMEEKSDGSGFFREVNLNPVVTVLESSMIEKATALHKKANDYCFIANSVKFPVHHNPVCHVDSKRETMTGMETI